jgi:uncharacterized protein Usg
MIAVEFIRQLNGYSLTTAHIFYRMPDYKKILQSYVWQEYDLFPHFPVLHEFLNFWEAKLDGPLYRVEVTHNNLIKPVTIKHVNGDFKIE